MRSRRSLKVSHTQISVPCGTLKNLKFSTHSHAKGQSKQISTALLYLSFYIYINDFRIAQKMHPWLLHRFSSVNLPLFPYCV